MSPQTSAELLAWLQRTHGTKKVKSWWFNTVRLCPAYDAEAHHKDGCDLGRIPCTDGKVITNANNEGWRFE